MGVKHITQYLLHYTVAAIIIITIICSYCCCCYYYYSFLVLFWALHSLMPPSTLRGLSSMVCFFFYCEI